MGTHTAIKCSKKLPSGSSGSVITVGSNGNSGQRKLLGTGTGDKCHVSCCECATYGPFGCTSCEEKSFLRVVYPAGGVDGATVARGMCMIHRGLGRACESVCVDHNVKASLLLPATSE